MLFSALDGLIQHNSIRLHVSQCFHCVKTDNVQKTPLTSFLLENVFRRREMLFLPYLA